METISGAGNWNLTIQMEEDGVILLRCHTPDERAVLPETVWGLPVIALGDRALSPDTDNIGADSAAAEKDKANSITLLSGDKGGTALLSGDKGGTASLNGNKGGTPRQLQITCGPAEAAQWNNARLRDLALPRTLRRVGNYALYNCRALQTIRLFDSVQIWGNGVLMNCRELDTIQISRDGQSGAEISGDGHWPSGVGSGDNGTTAYFAGELNRELDISVLLSDQLLLRLIFPEYRESYEENCPAHHFDYVIEGLSLPPLFPSAALESAGIRQSMDEKPGPGTHDRHPSGLLAFALSDGTAPGSSGTLPRVSAFACIRRGGVADRGSGRVRSPLSSAGDTAGAGDACPLSVPCAGTGVDRGCRALTGRTETEIFTSRL